MAYSSSHTYPYPHRFTSVKDSEDYAKRLYASLIEKDGKADYVKDKSTDADLKDILARPEWYGAKGDGVTDDTTAIKAMFASGKTTFLFSEKTYVVSIGANQYLAKFSSIDHIRIWGSGAVIKDTATHTSGGYDMCFWFDGCDDIEVIGVNYLGAELGTPSEMTTKGVALVRASTSCKNIRVSAEITNARYGIFSGEYSDEAQGECSGIFADLRCVDVGYPLALYLAHDVHARINVDGFGRASYLAGVTGGDIDIKFKNCKSATADVATLLTDAKTGTGTSRGCSNLKINATDIGSTLFVANSWAAGIALSRADAGITYSDIDVNVNVTGTDTIASTVGAFVIVSGSGGTTVGGIAYSYDWESTISLNNIRVSGIVDRSSQTVDSHGYGELYIYTKDSGDASHRATVRNLCFDKLNIISGSGSNQPFLFYTDGQADAVVVSGCNFSSYNMTLRGDQKYGYSIINTKAGSITATYYETIRLINSEIGTVVTFHETGKTTSPAAGLYNNGEVVWKTNPAAGGSSGWQCINRIDTAMRVAAVATDTTLEVDSTTGILADDIIGILLDDGTIHWTDVDSITDGDTLVISSGIPAGDSAAIANAVYTTRWSTLACNDGQDVRSTASPSFAGLTVDTTTLYVDAANNRVGVGTTGPTTMLEVGGTNNIFTVNGPTGYKAQIDDGGGVFSLNAVGSGGYFAFKSDGTEKVRISSAANLGINQTTFGTSATRTIAVSTGTPPSDSPADAFQQYSADITSGNAAPHFRTEAGDIVKLYKQVLAADLKEDYTTGDLDSEAEVIAAMNLTNAKVNDLITALINTGLLAAA